MVFLVALYLLLLGGGALVRPETAKRFLGRLATTQRLHFTELGLRVVAGAAFVLSAPQMTWARSIAVFGWVLVGTSILLALIPWRYHQRFAAWAVPQAMQHVALVGVASLVGGFGLIVLLLLPRAVG
ncbi:MAG TPA: hypothetical protein DGD08_04255 [Gemmatimonas aurantiaca]|uniref:Uncharacterized protein n=1 Tax=Gemmatimonas aurantiaca TaxID=173480 RepID=A0A3D4V6X7_9BACT|nr:hypothetical protein [Gemmatimonas aurantiaca]